MKNSTGISGPVFLSLIDFLQKAGTDCRAEGATDRTDYYVSSDNDRHSNVRTIAIGLEGHAGNWAYDGMKTTDCEGSTDASDNRCWYDWTKE